MVDSCARSPTEVIRVAREVGIEGKLGGQADVPGVSGTWKDLTDNVNLLAGNLTSQVRNIALVTTAVANGDLSQKITVEAQGRDPRAEEHDQHDGRSAAHVRGRGDARRARGRHRRQARRPGRGARASRGTWKDLTDNVNLLAGNLTDQVRNIALVTTAVANGDLSQKITVEAQGRDPRAQEHDQHDGRSAARVRGRGDARREARSAPRASSAGRPRCTGVSGTWKDLTDNVNLMARNLTDPGARHRARSSTAVANGDLSQKFVVEAKGEIAALADTINTMTDTLRTFAAQVTRVAREVGIEGKLGGQADVPGVVGHVADLTDNVNLLAGNLTNQVRNIALVTTAVANGDLSQKITVDAQGRDPRAQEHDQRDGRSAAHVRRRGDARRARGRHRGQARRPGQVPGVAGTWKDLTDNVNFMASNLTNQVRGIVKVVTAVANGDLSQKFVVEAKGEIAALADTINAHDRHAAHVRRAGDDGRARGRHRGQARRPGARCRASAGTWRDLTDNVNMLAGNLTNQVRNIALVTTAVANGDLSQKITVEAKGEILELKNTINAMVDQLRTFAREVTRVAREVGTEGKLGGQAQVPGVAGTWQDLTDNVNLMASNLTNQVRGIVEGRDRGRRTATSTQKLVVEAKGEIAALADTINDMTDTLRTFADQVTTVAREVGIEGKLGGQARVPGAAGTWTDLTDNVNMLAGNLTVAGPQHRARHDRGRQRRSLAEDHRRGEGRDPRAQGHHQRDGRAAAHVRRRGDARRARGRHRRQARRPGRRCPASPARGRT